MTTLDKCTCDRRTVERCMHSVGLILMQPRSADLCILVWLSAFILGNLPH